MSQRPYIRRRSRRMLSFTTVLGLGFALGAMQAGKDSLWLPLVWSFQSVVQAEGVNATLDALQLFLLLDVPPFALSLLIVALLGFALAFVVSLLVITIIPYRFQGYLDGIVGTVGLILLIEGFGLGGYVRAAFGNVGSFLFYWATIMSTSSVVWKHLPFGFSYESGAKRTIPLPKNAIADRVIPGRAPGADLADIDLINRPPEEGENLATVHVADEGEDGTLAFDIHHDSKNGFLRGQTMSYSLTPIGPDTTEVTIKTTLTGLAPMSLWDFWSRHFAEDYADHIDARLNGTKDGSLYAHLQGAARRKLDKKRLKSASA